MFYMRRLPNRRWFVQWLAVLAGLWVSVACAGPSRGVQVDSYLEIIRNTPYWYSQGVAHNLETIRRWVLLGRGYCSRPHRQLLFDRRGRFLTFIDNADTTAATVERLNEVRRRLADEGKVAYWSAGKADFPGYPFALSCDQPDVDIGDAIDRLAGGESDYLVWGTWDGMHVGTRRDPVSLVALIHTVYARLKDRGTVSFPESMMPAFLGKTIIESGGKKHALSTESARGIMQLQPSVLDDCEIPKDFRLHRMAQVDCALRLVQQNDRNLAEPFNAVFGKLPEPKRDRLYRLLLIQAYQIGVGRMIELLKDKELGEAARYFAQHEDRFNAEDIQTGMMFHNLGRRDIGMMTLYYVTDVGIATRALCASKTMHDDLWCQYAVQHWP